MNKRKNYLPPAAELILLAPCENLAVNDFAFNIFNQFTNKGYFDAEAGGGASGYGFHVEGKYTNEGTGFAEYPGTGTD